MAVIRNLTVAAIELNDMGGVTIPPSGDFDLNNTPQEEVDTSNDLATAIAAGDIVYLLADGTPLSPADSQTVADSANSPTGADTNLPKTSGFEMGSETTLTFNKGTGTATLSPVGSPLGSFTVWSGGSKYTFTQALTLVFPLDANARVLYIDKTGTLVSSPSPVDSDPIWKETCLVGEAVFNVTAATYRGMFDLRFGVEVDTSLRQNILMTHGATYNNGLQVGDIILNGDGSLDTHSQLSISDGTINLVDVQKNTFDFTQQLFLPAKIQIAYLQGTERKVKPPGDFPMIWQGSTADYTGLRLAYNQINPITKLGSLVEVQEGWYTLTHIMMAMGTVSPMTGFVSTKEYATLEEARLDMLSSIESLLQNRVQRRYFVPVATVIMRTSSEYTNTTKAIFVPMGSGADFHDHRTSKDGLINPVESFAFDDFRFNFVGQQSNRLRFELDHVPENKLSIIKAPDVDMNMNLVPDYTLNAVAREQILAGGEVSMGVNGEIQTFPQTGNSENSSSFTTRDPQVSASGYFSAGSGLSIYSDTTTANTVFFRGGTFQQDGSVIWGTEISLGLSATVKEINTTPINDLRMACCIVTADGEAIVVVLSNVGTEVSIDDSIVLKSSGTVVSCDITYTNLNHLVVGYAWDDAGTSDLENEYFNVDSSGILDSPADPRSFDFAGSNAIKVNIGTENSNVFLSALSDSSVYVAENKWANNRKQYRTRATSVIFGPTSGFKNLGGIHGESSTIFVQAETTTGDWQTYHATYSSGSSINSENPTGSALTGIVATLITGSSGIVSNLVLNDAYNIEIYSLDNNYSNGWVNDYTSVITIPTAASYSYQLIFMDVTYVSLFNGDPAANNNMYFIDSNAVNTDKYIGTAPIDIAPGTIGKVNLGLPIINNEALPPIGSVFQKNSYTYQVVSKHSAVMFINEVTTVTSRITIFGSNFQMVNDEQAHSTSSTTFTTASSITTSVLPKGTYRIQVSYAWGLELPNATGDFEARLVEDGATKGSVHIEESTKTGQNVYVNRTLYSTFDVAAIHEYSLEYRVHDLSDTARLSDITIEIIAVS